MEIFQLEQTSVQWKLFSVSSKVSMKAVLLHNRNKFSSVPVVQEGHMKKTHVYLPVLLQKNMLLWTQVE